jgi:hypothetical protein
VRRTSGAALCAVVALAMPVPRNAGAAVDGTAATAPPAGGLHWIIEGPGNQDALAAVQRLDPDLAATFFDNHGTTILAGDARPSEAPRNEVPPGWSAVAAQHYTSYGSCPTNSDGIPQRACASLTQDIDNGSLVASGVPVAMFDDENWTKTPDSEKVDVCSTMRQFTRLAHAHQLETIMAPDQNLASPGVITSYQGGESENWQTYLRLGLARCAAASGTARYHIMSQPFETTWCGGQGSACEGNEAEFTDFVTEAALQAQTVNPDIALTAGLSTNPRYDVTPQAMFQDTRDVSSLVHGIWLNVAGNPTNPATAVQYLELLAGLVPFYFGGGQSLTQTFPTAPQPAAASLATPSSDISFLTGGDLPAGTVIPAGAYKFEPWTDGSSGSSRLGIEVGYCTAPACTDRKPIIGSGSWNADLSAGDPGITNTYRTSSPTTLPGGGPYRLYVDARVESAGSFDLLYGSGSESTNLAMPRTSSEPAPPMRSSVLFARSGARLNTSRPAGQASQSLDLSRRGATATFTSVPVLRAGDVVPAGAWDFQYWASGSGSATLDLQAGYCNAACTDRIPIIGPGSGWRAAVGAGTAGATDPGGAFTTTAATSLPASGGPYRLYWTVTVANPANVELGYDSAHSPTNVATPLPLATDRS